jgi:hypothetical protein
MEGCKMFHGHVVENMHACLPGKSVGVITAAQG